MKKKEVKKKKSSNGINVHRFFDNKLTIGQRSADIVAEIVGSWGFIIFFLVFIVIWMGLNAYVLLFGIWDPYPFILLNFVLSCLAALQAPIILMSQNRQSQKDRQRSEYDYAVNRKAEREILDISVTLCFKFLPKPIPGSIIIRSFYYNKSEKLENNFLMLCVLVTKPKNFVFLV